MEHAASQLEDASCKMGESTRHQLPRPDLGPRSVVDMLIGIDYAELHYSIKEICGQPGWPVARLTPGKGSGLQM